MFKAGFLCRSSRSELFREYFREVPPQGLAKWLHPKVGDQESLSEVPVPPLRYKGIPSKHKANIYSANL